jgi:hypothetical protein
MCGWAKGTPTLHPIAYADPNRPGRSLIAPGWLVRSALVGAGRRGATLHVGDPYLGWLYQPTVRTLRVPLYGDDLSFVQDGAPAIFLSDSSFSAFYPWYHEPGDTPDKLDPASLERMGHTVLAIIDELGQTQRASADDPVWYALPGYVAGAGVIFGIGIASLLPGLWLAVNRPGAALGVRLVHAAIMAVLLWRNPVPTVWILALPNVVPLFVRGFWLRLLAYVPAGALLAMTLAAWHRGVGAGLWFQHWELAALGLAVLATWFMPTPKRGGSRSRRKARRGLPKG